MKKRSTRLSRRAPSRSASRFVGRVIVEFEEERRRHGARAQEGGTDEGPVVPTGATTRFPVVADPP